MRMITDIKEIFKNIEVGDTIEYEESRYLFNKKFPLKKSIVTNIEKCSVNCGDNICNIMISVYDEAQNNESEGCYMFSKDKCYITALYKQEDFLKEEEFIL